MSKPLNLVLWCAALGGFALMTQDAQARPTSKKKWSLVTPGPGVKDLHTAVGGQITKASTTPAPDAEQTNGGNYDCAWNTALAAGATVTVELERNGQGKWGSYWWTYDGKLGGPGGPPAGALASLNLGDSGLGNLIYADNEWGTGNLFITNIVATIENSLDEYDSPNWEVAIGSDVPLPDIALTPGQSQVPFAPISFGANQWLKIQADFNGETQTFGYTQVPEPASLVLLALGGVTALRRRT